jgi:hypothetical protein
VEFLGLLLTIAGCLVMTLAGLRYWRSDPMLFLMTPIWGGNHRGLFAAPGWHLYMMGTALAIGGPTVLIVERMLG